MQLFKETSVNIKGKLCLDLIINASNKLPILLLNELDYHQIFPVNIYEVSTVKYIQ